MKYLIIATTLLLSVQSMANDCNGYEDLSEISDQYYTVEGELIKTNEYKDGKDIIQVFDIDSMHFFGDKTKNKLTVKNIIEKSESKLEYGIGTHMQHTYKEGVKYTILVDKKTGVAIPNFCFNPVRLKKDLNDDIATLFK